MTRTEEKHPLPQRAYLARVFVWLRWVACFPSAVLLSFLCWAYVAPFFGQNLYLGGSSLLLKYIGLTPYVIRTALPSFTFLVVGAGVSPSPRRGVCFVFFSLSLFYSSSQLDLSLYGNPVIAEPILWLATIFGMVVGALMGLAFMLRVQGRRNRRVLAGPS